MNELSKGKLLGLLFFFDRDSCIAIDSMVREPEPSQRESVATPFPQEWRSRNRFDPEP